MIKKFVSTIVIVGLVVVNFGILNPSVTLAASITTATDTMSRLKASTASDHTIMFVTPTGVASGRAITLTFSNGFTGISSMAGPDFDLAENSGSVCTAGSWTEKSVVSLMPNSSQFGIIGNLQNVTISSGGAGATINPNRCIRLRAGLNATDTTGSGPGDSQITNGAVGSSDTITISGDFGDSGIISVDIIDDDQVTVTANVNQTLTFDLDTAATDQESSPPYTVPLGVLSSGSVTRSGTASVNMIIAEGLTNASGGMNVIVRSANTTHGLTSTSVPSDFIPSTTGTMAAGTPNYGLCVATAALSGFTRATGFVSDTCALGSGTNQIRGITGTGIDILTSSAPVSSGHAEIVVNAAISGSTPAHTDYTDTLTFVASASF